MGGVDLTGVLVDDDAEEELSAMLHRARKVRTLEVKKESGENDAAARVGFMLFYFDFHTIQVIGSDKEKVDLTLVLLTV